MSTDAAMGNCFTQFASLSGGICPAGSAGSTQPLPCAAQARPHRVVSRFLDHSSRRVLARIAHLGTGYRQHDGPLVQVGDLLPVGEAVGLVRPRRHHDDAVEDVPPFVGEHLLDHADGRRVDVVDPGADGEREVRDLRAEILHDVHATRRLITRGPITMVGLAVTRAAGGRRSSASGGGCPTHLGEDPGALTELDQIAVRVPEVAPDLDAMILGLGQELPTP